MKLFIKDITNNIHIKDKRILYEELSGILEVLSNNKYTEIKLYKESISKYLIYLRPISPSLWKIDSPIKLREVHKQCYATKEQCVAIIRELFEKGNIDDVPGFIEVPIQDFTLDEMIEFKKEEEMLLRGEDPFEEEDTTSELEDHPKDEMGSISKPETKANIETPKKEPATQINKNVKSDNYFQI
ncbi:hypothetical protein [uncultured Aquimarina sp.]|uniref:hypothetical protein n=1 Tax=uncultured Aquimarina sp. TaxID=575652 RepID=UPI00262F004F|nr:hypothetical protein [uncultured Aquimarina sp.]